jgi:hypothetical protein
MRPIELCGNPSNLGISNRGVTDYREFCFAITALNCNLWDNYD